MKVLLTEEKLVDGLLGEGVAFQTEMTSDGYVDMTAPAARFHGVGRSATHLMTGHWYFEQHNMVMAKHAYIEYLGGFIEVVFTFRKPAHRLATGKIYRVTNSDTENGARLEEGAIVVLVRQEPDTYEGDLIYLVHRVNDTEEFWVTPAHGLELV